MMNRQSFHAMQVVVKREEKETRLTQFILGEIAAGRVSLTGQWSVVALSLESPVITALRRVVNDLGGASGLRIHAVLTRTGRHAIGTGFDVIEALSVRTAENSRLLDAHEQLVLGSASSWTGDCMRRDPRERDAFETFGSNNVELANWAMKSFERIWDGAHPLTGDGRRIIGAGQDVLDRLVAGDDTRLKGVVTATSRH